MVAYNFKRRFVEPILRGWKQQTIRARGRRIHAKEGSELQLYTGQRTPNCTLIAKATCTRVDEAMIAVDADGIGAIALNGIHLSTDEMERFARQDGFLNLDDMAGFWRAEHGEGNFIGLVIQWELNQ